MVGDRDSCRCFKCRGACKRRPGYFVPGQVEKVAEFLGTTIQDLFGESLAVDYLTGEGPDGTDIYVLMPIVLGQTAGVEAPFNPVQMPCVFLKGNGDCSIHPVRPAECAAYLHGDTDSAARHVEIGKKWLWHQGQIESLLGYKPVTPFGSAMDCFLNLLGGD